MGSFVRGLAPAVAVLMVLVAWQVFQTEGSSLIATIIIAALSLGALIFNAPPALVLLTAGLLGMVVFR